MLNLYTQENFYTFLKNRQSILYLKSLESPPWTEDKILQTEKFCNIDREDDRGTINLREYIWENKRYTIEDKIIFSFIYRFCVSSKTILEISNLSPNKAFDEIISPNFKFSWSRSVPYHLPLISKKNRVKDDGSYEENLKWIVNKLYKNRYIIFKYLRNHRGIDHLRATEELTNILKNILTKRFPFYIAQSLADLFFFTNYLDISGPTYLGIGALKGLNKMNKENLNNIEYIDKLIKEMPFDLLKLFPRGVYPVIIEHGLCEFTKYTEYLEGDRKRKYYFSKGE